MNISHEHKHKNLLKNIKSLTTSLTKYIQQNNKIYKRSLIKYLIYIKNRVKQYIWGIMLHDQKIFIQECKTSSILKNQSVKFTILTAKEEKLDDLANQCRKSIWQNSMPVHD